MIMPKTENRYRTIQFLPYILFGMILLGGLLFIFTFSIGINKYDLHDYIEGVIWADATLRSSSIINPEYVYYYIVPFGSNLIMAPFVRWFGASLIANQLGMLVYYLLYLAVLFRLARALYDDSNSRLIFCSVLSLFFYTYLGDNLLHHLLVYGIGFVCFMGMLSCLINIDKGHDSPTNRILLAVFCLWSSANGIACAALSGIAVLAALIYARYKDRTLFSRDSIVIYLGMIMPIAAGLLVFRYFDAQATSLNMYDDRFMLAGEGTVITRLTHDIFMDYLKIFYFTPANTPLFSVRGIYFFIKLAFALAIPVMPVYLHRKHRESFIIPGLSGTGQTMLKTSLLLVILACIGQYCFFITYSNRYLFNGLLCVLICGAVGYAGLVRNTGKNTKLLPVLGLVMIMSFRLVFGYIPFGDARKTELERIYSVLKEENVIRGYVCHRYFKGIELFADGELLESKITYDTDAKKFYVDYDRIYPDELEKPATDRFFVINDTYYNIYHSGDPLLEELCTGKQKLGRVTIYFFDTDDWNTLFTVKQ